MAQAWWQGTGADLRGVAVDAVIGAMARQLPFPLEPAQRAAWDYTVRHLQDLAAAIPGLFIFLEFAIPRMGRRADAVVVAGGLVFVVEYKVGASAFARHAVAQVHGYALDIKSFHETSHNRRIVPLLVATEAPAQPVALGFAQDGVAAPMCLSAGDLAAAMGQMLAMSTETSIDPKSWAAGRYRPTPTIIEAAQALFRGHAVAEISRAEAGAENLTRTAAAVDAIVRAAREQNGKSLCFVTGVPGAGKTLAGLNIVCGRMEQGKGEDSTFLSGNGPLVSVLREALKRDLRRRSGTPEPGDPDSRHISGRSPDKFVQNVHHFRDRYVGTDEVPSEHVVVFDEAQRAWNQEQTARFMRERGHGGFTQSEPEFLLSVMNRRRDWCTMVCLVGEGQEINTGEAGIAAWVQALDAAQFREWRVHAPPQLMAADSSLERPLRWLLERQGSQCDPALHLGVSVRSFRAETVSAFIAALLGNDSQKARDVCPDCARFPIVRTRSLAAARAWLRQQRRGTERAGLLASSNAIRLKPEGLHVKAKVDVASWFLNMGDDIRASNSLEDAATEFDVQGLELDWTGVAWDLNLMRGSGGWVSRRFRGTAWQSVNDAAARNYVVNSYRVLLTRARQGMVIVVPTGDPRDPTRPPDAYDAIDAWLAECGIALLEQ